MLHGTDAFFIPFTLLWCGFAVFWTVGASQAGGAFGLFGGPFVAVGLYVVVGRFFVDAATRARTVYGVTDRRVLIVRVGRRHTTTSIEGAQLGQLQIKEGAGGRATITFGPTNWPWGAVPPGWPMGSQARPSQFDSVEDGRRVYGLIRDLTAQR
jgi:hypothetical protein